MPSYDSGAAQEVAELTRRVDAARQAAARADQRVAGLIADPALTHHPDRDTLLTAARTDWHLQRRAAQLHRATGAADVPRPDRVRPDRVRPEPTYRGAGIDRGPAIGR